MANKNIARLSLELFLLIACSSARAVPVTFYSVGSSSGSSGGGGTGNVTSPVTYGNNISFSAPTSTPNASVGVLLADTTGDWEMASNATYNTTTNQWNRVDITKPVWMLDWNVYGSIPGEGGLQGWCLYRIATGANPIGASYGAVGSPEIGLCSTYNRDIVVGGQNIELDGSGSTLGFSRFINSNASGNWNTGIVRNFLGDLKTKDSAANGPTNDSWFLGFSSTTQTSNMRVVYSSPTAGAVPQTYAIWDATGTMEADLRSVPGLPGAEILTSSGSNPVLNIRPYGNTGVNDQSAAGLYIDGTNAQGDIVANIYSNSSANQGLGSLFRVHQANASFAQPLVVLQSDSTNFPACNLMLRGGIPSAYWWDNTRAAPYGQFQISSHNDIFRFEGRNAGNSAFDSGIQMARSTGTVNTWFGRGYPGFSTNIANEFIGDIFTKPTDYIVGVSSQSRSILFGVQNNGSASFGATVPVTISSAVFVGTVVSTAAAGTAGTSVTALCPANTFVKGGGCNCTGIVAATSIISEPSCVTAGCIANGWVCQVAGGTGGACAARAICGREQ